MAKDGRSGVAMGPTTLEGLFDWATYNADVLMENNQYKESFQAFASSSDIKIYDFFSGTGNGSVSMKQQYFAMASKAGVTSHKIVSFFPGDLVFPVWV